MSSILDEQLRFTALEQNGLMKSILTLGISERDLTLISQKTEDEQIKKIANLKIKQLNSEAINENINIWQIARIIRTPHVAERLFVVIAS
ncbi:hypothetical protein [Leuconostoc sp.]|uniref:hypothetical protein n=1 Tax=Leuconostoc sp. TaxID=1930076 RepID=UPI00257C4E16|nr:hypothetical protein [Leuconostoc sp.]